MEESVVTYLKMNNPIYSCESMRVLAGVLTMLKAREKRTRVNHASFHTRTVERSTTQPVNHHKTRSGLMPMRTADAKTPRKKEVVLSLTRLGVCAILPRLLETGWFEQPAARGQHHTERGLLGLVDGKARPQKQHFANVWGHCFPIRA